MITAYDLVDELIRVGCNLFAGVPDSTLPGLTEAASARLGTSRSVVAANEGGAVGIAGGHYLATGALSVVYMQNSGFLNALSPLSSIAVPQVAGLPMFCVIGWRGEPGIKDEPQHHFLGLITKDLLSLLGLPCLLAADNAEELSKQVTYLANVAKSSRTPVALLVRPGTIDKCSVETQEPSTNTSTLMYREEAIKVITDTIGKKGVIVATTGGTSRELFELRERHGAGHNQDFLCVGAMGHANQIALGMAMAPESTTVYSLDGDGALIMHLGGMATIAAIKPKSFVHLLLNNGVHDSVGGTVTISPKLDLPAVARSFGYETARRVETQSELRDSVSAVREVPGPHFIEILIREGSRSDLGRPTVSPTQNAMDVGLFLRKRTGATTDSVLSVI